jgi:cytochrome P450
MDQRDELQLRTTVAEGRVVTGHAYPPGPKINFLAALIGPMLPKLFPFDPLAFALDNAQKFGDIAYYRVGPLRIYQLNSPELIRQILVEHPEKFHKPVFIRRGFGPFVGNGLFTSDGDLWKQQRKLMQPAFNHTQIGKYGDIMVTHAQRLADSFQDGEVREISADMVKLTLGVVIKSLFGADFTLQAEEIGDLMTAALEAANQRLISAVQIPTWVPTRRNLQEKHALARIETMLRELIQIRRASTEQWTDLLSVLLKAVDEDSGLGMSDRQLRDEMMTLFLAGHETTANALTWTWYVLSKHPDVEAKLSDELRRVLGGRMPQASICIYCHIPKWCFANPSDCILRRRDLHESRWKMSSLEDMRYLKEVFSPSTLGRSIATRGSLKIQSALTPNGSHRAGRPGFRATPTCRLAAAHASASAMALR